MQLKAYGDRAVLLAGLDVSQRTSLIQKLEAGLPDSCEEFVVGYDSLLLIGFSMADAQAWIDLPDTAAASALERRKTRAHTVEVIYNGADLEAVAQACGLSVQRVIELHSAPTYTVRMMGFSPGFPYLEGLDPQLHLERRASPRNHIAPGSVAIGGSHAGIYSVGSPGGWHLLGQTEFPLFNLEAAGQPGADPEQVFALSIGDQLRFQPGKVE